MHFPSTVATIRLAVVDPQGAATAPALPILSGIRMSVWAENRFRHVDCDQSLEE